MILVNSEYFKYKGSRCYCSPDAARRIRRSIARKPINAIHMLGSGNYHYLSLFYLERIEEDFSLFLFDNHSDRERGAFSDDTLSCGSWVTDALKLPRLKDFRWIRTIREAKDVKDIYKGITSPLYISIDLDVLSTQYAKTNWDQGTMRIEELTDFLKNCPLRIIGVDICGAENDMESMFSKIQSEGTNQKTILSIIESLNDI